MDQTEVFTPKPVQEPNVPPVASSSPPPQPQAASQSFPEQSGPGFSPKNILKLLIGLFAIVVLVFVLFAFVVPGIGKNNQKVTISYWGVLEDQSVMQGIISDFEKDNPTITIDYKKQDIQDYQTKLTTRISEGSGPDIFSFQNTWTGVFSKTLLPLSSDTISKTEFNSLFYPVVKKDLIYNGAIYGVSLGIDNLALFTNTDMFKKAGVSVPKTWNDFINVARGFTIKDQSGKITTSGAAIGTFDNVSHSQDIISLLFAQDGVDLNSLPSTSDKVADALRFYTAFAQGDGSVWDSTLDQSTLAFSKGNLAMFFGYYWDYFTIKSAAPTLSFSVNKVPQLNFQSPTIANYWAEGVSAKSKNQKEALLFIKFLAKRQTQEKLYQEESKIRSYGQPPAIVDMANKLQNGPLSVFVSQAQNSTSSYFTDKTFSSFLSSSVSSILGGGSPDNAATTLIQSVLSSLQPSKQ